MIKGQFKVSDSRLLSRIGYQFNQIELLKLALTHRSVSHKHNYERLEFLGDSLLGMIIANYLYEHYPNENEGRLTRMRATLVRQEALGKIANDLQLSRFDKKDNKHTLGVELGIDVYSSASSDKIDPSTISSASSSNLSRRFCE